MPRRTLNPQSLLFVAAIAMAAGSFLPLRLTGWTGWLRGPLMTVIAPIASPMNALGTWLRPGESRRGEDDASTAELRQQAEYYKSELLRTEQQNEQLRRVIEGLQGGVAYGPPLRLMRVEAARIAADLGAGTIDVRRGSVHGVRLGTVGVATTAPQHLVGLVTDVGPTVSTIHVITDRKVSPGLIATLILPAGTVTAEALARAPRCQFRPTGDGSLAGEIGAEAAAGVQRGDAAYLDDPSWPPAAQRLIVGRVLRTENSENPLFKRLTIRPDLDLTRVPSVILRTAAEDAPAGGAP
jgi:cell shape-determining protein MreC